MKGRSNADQTIRAALLVDFVFFNQRWRGMHLFVVQSAQGAVNGALEFVRGATDGLIALTAGGEGAIARLFADGQTDKAKAYLERLRALFPDRLYIELSRRGDATEEAAEAEEIFAADQPGGG